MRARKSPNRVLSLLHYAASNDVSVSQAALRRLHESVAGVGVSDGRTDHLPGRSFARHAPGR